MSTHTATCVICDEFLISLTGKLNILGLYTGDITISSDEQTVSQLVAVFHIEFDLNTPFRSLLAEVRLPGEPPVRNQIPFVIPQLPEDRKRWVLRWPILLQQPKLRPGRIETKVVHDQGEIDTGVQWIVRSPVPIKH